MRSTRTTMGLTAAAIAIGLLAIAPAAWADSRLIGDINGDGVVDFNDIDAFVAALSTGGGGHVGPIAYYPFDGNARNYGCYRDHGTEYGDVTYVVGVDGDAAYFDGSSYIDSNFVPLLQADDSFSFSFWAEMPAEIPTATHLVPVGLDIEYAQQITTKIEESTGKMRLTFWDDGYSGGHKAITPDPVTDGQWHHFTCVRDADAVKIRLYVDGELADSTSAAGLTHPINESNPVSFYFGASHRTDSEGGTHWAINHFTGAVDEVRIYDRVLSDTEIESLSQMP